MHDLGRSLCCGCVPRLLDIRAFPRRSTFSSPHLRNSCLAESLIIALSSNSYFHHMRLDITRSIGESIYPGTGFDFHDGFHVRWHSSVISTHTFLTAGWPFIGLCAVCWSARYIRNFRIIEQNSNIWVSSCVLLVSSPRGSQGLHGRSWLLSV